MLRWTPRVTDLAGGLQVRRALPVAARRSVGPFVFFDHFSPVSLAADADTDVGPHPHIGLATVTYLFEGGFLHRDSLGTVQEITPGAVNWMTAGRGISHSERFDTLRERGGDLHGIQAWVALPAADEEIDPDFVHFDAEQLPSARLDGATVSLIAGDAFGLTSPVKTRSPLFYVHAELTAGAHLELLANYPERAAYIVQGAVQVEGESFEPGQMLVFERSATPTITAIQPTTLMLLGGEPVGPRHIWWNFVSSSRERIEQAKADWKEGRFAAVPGESEFVPLPEAGR